MEDALVPFGFHTDVKKLDESLNPCCNGRCTRTVMNAMNNFTVTVLILVVMEDALVQPMKNRHVNFSLS